METFIQTHSGARVSILDPAPNDIKLEDIAWALAHQCRFAGHCKKFYSVAEHSMLVASYLPRELSLAGLLHDAAEAYIIDIPSPLKALIPGYKSFENRFESAILVALGLKLLTSDEKAAIKIADKIALATEAEVLMGDPKDWSILRGVEPRGAIKGHDPYEGYTIFIERFTAYKEDADYRADLKVVLNDMSDFFVAAGKL